MWVPDVWILSSLLIVIPYLAAHLTPGRPLAPLNLLKVPTEISQEVMTADLRKACGSMDISGGRQPVRGPTCLYQG